MTDNCIIGQCPHYRIDAKGRVEVCALGVKGEEADGSERRKQIDILGGSKV